MPAKRRFIAHVDMDAFFASIEQRDNPRYRGKPVIVGADPKAGRGRGVVSTSSYEARIFGVHSAMPISAAYRKCPQGIFLPVDMEKYAAVSRQIYGILYSFTPDVEPVSIDEAFLDITGSYHLFAPPLETCRMIKSRIREETSLSVSVGLAPVKMAAKIASDLKKPDGLVEVTEDGLKDFLRPLGIEKIWGLGEKSKEVLNAIGIHTIGDLAGMASEELTALFGKNGEHFWRLANGIDEREVETDIEAKSISNETTFDRDIADDARVKAALLGLCDKVSGRLRREGFKARTMTMKIRLADFSTFTRSVTLEDSTNFCDSIYDNISRLYDNFDKGAKKVRLVGVRASGLCPSGLQDNLFGGLAEKKREDIHRALDRIRDKFGGAAIFRAGSKDTD